MEEELKNKAYRPSRSILFAARKPKLREIFAADFRDRVVHHVLVDYLERIYEPIFIHDSYACRKDKGTHAAIMRLQNFLRKVSKNGRVKAYYLQLDIKDFFTSIDKSILFTLIKKKVINYDILWLAAKIIFHDPTERFILRDRENVMRHIPSNKSLFGKDNKKGLPIGNLISQFFANVYMNELDQFIKHSLKARFFIRYVDDFILLSRDKDELLGWRNRINDFLGEYLGLTLHSKRVKLQPISNGVDFLGYIVRKDYILVRRRVINNMYSRLRYFTRYFKCLNLTDTTNPITRPMWRNNAINALRACLQSYLGHFRWASSHRLVGTLIKKKIVSDYFKVCNYKLQLIKTQKE